MLYMYIMVYPYISSFIIYPYTNSNLQLYMTNILIVYHYIYTYIMYICIQYRYIQYVFIHISSIYIYIRIYMCIYIYYNNIIRWWYMELDLHDNLAPKGLPSRPTPPVALPVSRRPRRALGGASGGVFPVTSMGFRGFSNPK